MGRVGRVPEGLYKLARHATSGRICSREVVCWQQAARACGREQRNELMHASATDSTDLSGLSSRACAHLAGDVEGGVGGRRDDVDGERHRLAKDAGVGARSEVQDDAVARCGRRRRRIHHCTAKPHCLSGRVLMRAPTDRAKRDFWRRRVGRRWSWMLIKASEAKSLQSSACTQQQAAGYLRAWLLLSAAL